MREFATAEEKTFDLMFYGSIAAFVGARTVFVAGNWAQFTASPLAILAIWITPGFSLYGGLLSAIIFMVLLARLMKVRVGSILDALALSLPVGLAIGKIGSLLGASEVGQATGLPLSVFYAGYPQARHPIQIYEMLTLVLLALGSVLLVRQSFLRRWQYGMVGIIFFLAYSVSGFGLEFLKESRVYWYGLSANQWVLLGLACESLGALYIRGGGKLWAARVFGGFYARISKRRT